MAEQRQPFRFRLPWLPAPQPTPAAPRPSLATQTPSQPAAPEQRRPFRPAGVAPAQPPPPAQPPAKTEIPPPSSSTDTATPSRVMSQSASQPRVAPPTKAPAASPSRAVPQNQVTSQPASPARVGPQPQVTQAPPKSQSPSRGATRPAMPKAPTMPSISPRLAPQLPQEAKPLSTSKKQPNIAENSEAQIEQIKHEPTQSSPQKPQSVAMKAPPPEKVVESLGRQRKHPVPEEPMLKASDISGQKPESKLQQIKEIYGTSSKKPIDIVRGMNHEQPKRKPFVESHVPGSKAEMIEHPAPVLDERRLHPKEEVFERKEILKAFGNARENESGNHGHGRVSRSNHKHAMAGGEKAPLDKEIKEDSSKFLHKLGTRRDKHVLSEQEFSVITLTGENSGAIMHLTSEPSNRDRFIHIHRGYKANLDESYETTTDGEGSSKAKKSGETKLQEESATNLYVNNNTQGMNNSLVFNSSVTERNPGVQVVLSHNPVEPKKPGQQRETLETHKAQVSTTPAETLAYAPTIRRRCLQGLFLESSDSDPDKQDKPRRHGCRVGCAQKNNEEMINVL